MDIFLGTAVGLSLALILTGFLMDRSAVKARINGANGLPILVALIVSFLASIGVAVVSGLIKGWGSMGWILLFTIPYHVALGGLLIWRLQMLARRITEAERQKDEYWKNWVKKLR